MGLRHFVLHMFHNISYMCFITYIENAWCIAFIRIGLTTSVLLSKERMCVESDSLELR